MSALPQPLLDIAWDSAPFADPPIYTRIACKIISFETGAGRSFRLDRTEAGNCTIRILNLDGSFDPDYVDGPYYGKIKIGKKVRLQVVLGGTTYAVFTGFLKTLPRTFPGIVGDVVELQLVDAFLRLAKHKITTDEGDDFPEETSGARIVRVLDSAGFPGSGLYDGSYRDIDTGSSSVASMGLSARSALEHILHVEQTECGRFYIAPDGKATWLARHEMLTNALYIEPQIQFGGLGGIPYQDIVTEFGEDLLYNEIRASRVNGDEQVATDATSIEDYGSSGLDRGTLLSTSDTELESLVYYNLDRLKQPTTRFRQLGVFANVSDSVMASILGAGQGHRATVNKRHVRLGYTQSKQCQIEHISHSCNFQTGQWNSTFQLSDADSKRYWILNDATYGVLGSTTIWAF